MATKKNKKEIKAKAKIRDLKPRKDAKGGGGGGPIHTGPGYTGPGYTGHQ